MEAIGDFTNHEKKKISLKFKDIFFKQNEPIYSDNISEHEDLMIVLIIIR